MRTLLFLLMMIWFVPDVLGQQVKYTYDDSGNRTHRTIVLQQPPQSSPSSKGSPPVEDAPKTRASIPEMDDYARYEEQRYEDMLGERKVTIYPNPTRGMIQIEFEGYGEMRGSRLLLYNMQGNLMMQVNNVESYTTLDLTPYPAGMYILILTEGSARSEWRVIKQ